MSYKRNSKGQFVKGFVSPTKRFIKKKCEQCGGDYESKKSRAKKSRFCSRKCCGKWVYENKNKESFNYDRTGKNNPSWKGGVKYALGYKYILKPDHPSGNDKGYVQEHRLVMEKYLGRLLESKETVHHINGIKDDNRLENLELLSNQSKHIKKHIENGNMKLDYWKGRKRSPSTKRKMSISHKKIWQNRLSVASLHLLEKKD